MSIRNLHHVFNPSSIALIGASRKPHSVGAVVARNLFNAGFDGPVMPVHPEHQAIEGVLTYNSVQELPLTPDLAVIATPPDTVPGIVEQLGRRGTKAAVVITAGFGEGEDEEGRRRRQEMLDAAKPHLLRIVGPNCLGVMVPDNGLNAGFSHIAPKAGDLAFVTQSGAMVTAMLDWATPRGIGFSHVVSLGDMSDVDFGDMLDYLARDGDTRAILLYVEAVTNARKFMSAARVAARAKPVIVIKGGRHAEGAKAASSHTGALAGSDAVYDAAFRRAGMLRVYDLDELFDAAETLSNTPRVKGDRLAILTNGGGLGVLATDALIGEGGRLAEISESTMRRLNESLPATWSHGNPVDIIGDAPGSRYAGALKALLEDREVDAVLVMNCPTAVADSTEAAEAVVDTLEGRRHPVFTAWLGENAVREARELFARNRIPTYDTPEKGVRAFMHLVRYRQNQEMLMETPPSLPHHMEPDSDRVRRIVERALSDGRAWLGEAEAKDVLDAYGVPVVATRVVEDESAAVEAAEEIGFPVALKIFSPDITHKSEVGGVELELESAEDVRKAARRMRERVEQRRPDAEISGFTVQPMLRRPHAFELIAGITVDQQFGPVLLFGQGGTAVEVIRDQALALPPLNMNLARALMRQTRVYRLLEGYRDRPPAALDEIARALINLSQLASDFAEIAELDINPLLADAEGVVALDARIRVEKAEAPAPRRLAIRPYPKKLEGHLELPGGERIPIRPIRPEDEPALREAFRKLKPEDVRMRFFAPLRELSHSFAARLTQIDYDREMAFVALNPEDEGDLWGVVRISADPDNRTGEYAVIVRSDVTGRGIGYALMQRILDYARQRGIGEVYGDVLAENERMLQICRELGFRQEPLADETTIVRVRKSLDDRQAA